MAFENNACPRCHSALTDTHVAQMKRLDRRFRAIVFVLGLMAAGMGIYLGMGA